MVIVVVKRGTSISRKGSTVHLSKPVRVEGGGEKRYQFVTENVPLIDIDMLVIVGSNVRISSGAILMLTEANIPIIVHSKSVDAYVMMPFNVRIAEARRRLYKIIEDSSWRLHIGKAFVEGKFAGLVNLTRYLAYKDIEKGKDVKWILEEVRSIEKFRKAELDTVRNVEGLRLYEAKWSKKFWELLVTFIPREYGFTGRDPRSRDPINSAISYAYAIIYGLCTHALIASGLDPYAGIIHSERAGKTSLTYDFSEMFKPVALHTVIIASRRAKLTVKKDGYLSTNSLGVVTRDLYKILRRRHKSWRYTVRGEVYAKAWELRENIEKGTGFHPFIYSIKV